MAKVNKKKKKKSCLRKKKEKGSDTSLTTPSADRPNVVRKKQNISLYFTRLPLGTCFRGRFTLGKLSRILS